MILKFTLKLLKKIKADDIVVEPGCHVGNSTKIRPNLTSKGKIISIDNSPESIESMKDFVIEYENVEFTKADVRLHETLENVIKEVQKCDVLSVDLGGGYHPDTTLKIFFIWSSV